jgi:hypothetical protein
LLEGAKCDDVVNVSRDRKTIEALGSLGKGRLEA